MIEKIKMGKITGHPAFTKKDLLYAITIILKRR